MAIKSVNQLKAFFETGDKPTQQQFWDWLDSFIHKQEGIEISNVSGLEAALSNKADLVAGKVREEQLPNSFVDIIIGANSYEILANTLIRSFCVIDAAELIFSVGLTPEGKEYIEDSLIVTGSEILDVPKYFREATTIYFSGITSETVIRITKG